MNKPGVNKIKTVQINVMDNHNSLDDLKANAKVSNSGLGIVDSGVDYMKNLLANLKKPIVTDTDTDTDISTTEEVVTTSTTSLPSTLDEELVTLVEDVDIEHENDTPALDEDKDIKHENDISLTEEEIVCVDNNVVSELDETIEFSVEPNPYVFDIYEDYVNSHYIHRNIKIRNNEKIKIIIDGHYHNHNKINSWLKSPFNLYDGENMIFSYYGNSDDNTTEIETIISFRGDYVFINGKAYIDDNLMITSI